MHRNGIVNVAATIGAVLLVGGLLAGCNGSGTVAGAGGTTEPPLTTVSNTSGQSSLAGQPSSSAAGMPPTTTKAPSGTYRTPAGPAAGDDSHLPAGAVVHRDLAYGADPLQQLDVYQPAGAHDDPVIVMVHGGGWHRGDKAASGVVDNKVAHYLPKGYLIVSTNYRLSPTVTPVIQAQDVAAVLAYVQQHAQAWGGNPRSIVLMGHSAGANLVSLVAADPSYATNAGVAPWLGTVVLDSAAYNVVDIMQAQHLSLYDPVFGQDQQLWKAASPTLQLSGHPAPMLLVCGTGRANSCPQANAFAEAAQRLGSHVQVFPVALRHGEIDSELGTPIALTSTVDTFLRSLSLP